MAVEIVDLPINNMEIFRSKLVVYQGLTAQILFLDVVLNRGSQRHRLRNLRILFAHAHLATPRDPWWMKE